jgi:hypothetical protein
MLSPVPFLWNFSLVPCDWKLACALEVRYRYIFGCIVLDGGGEWLFNKDLHQQ